MLAEVTLVSSSLLPYDELTRQEDKHKGSFHMQSKEVEGVTEL